MKAITAQDARPSSEKMNSKTGNVLYTPPGISSGPPRTTGFFRLSNYRDRILSHIQKNPDCVRPAARRNEILRLLEGGLSDISASRSRIRWGIPFPGDEEHTVYVWFDALSNYITGVGYPEPVHQDWWPADLHIIGKDITRFHCVYWPAMLMAAGSEPARSVWAHGFINIGGAKLSKSAGTELGLLELIDRYGADSLRYFLMREVPWDGGPRFPNRQSLRRAVRSPVHYRSRQRPGEPVQPGRLHG